MFFVAALILAAIIAIIARTWMLLLLSLLAFAGGCVTELDFAPFRAAGKHPSRPQWGLRRGRLPPRPRCMRAAGTAAI